jgi:nucleotide-binding universal stress UspA family protein
VIPEFHIFSFQAETLDDSRKKFTENAVAHAQKYLAELASAAREAGVQCETTYLFSDSPYLSIIGLAKDKKCDLIAMASHGRKGIKAFLLGSETQKVLSHSPLPVLVFHASGEPPSASISS